MAINWTTDERRDLILSLGTHKGDRRLSPVQVSELLSKAIKVASPREVADDLGLADASLVHRFISLQRLSPELQGLVSWGKVPGHLTFSTAAEIARLSSDSEMQALTAPALENRMSKAEVQAAVQCMKRSKLEMAECIQQALQLRPVIERQFLYVGRLRGEAGQLDSNEARAQLRVGLVAKFGAENVVSASVKGGRFSFMLTEAGAKRGGDVVTSSKVEGFASNLILGTSDASN